MFFYRTWAGRKDLNLPDDPFNDQLFSQFLFHRWGFGALLGITLLASLFLNFGFLLSFAGNPNIRRLPHWTFLMLCVRDLAVTLVLIPTAIDWFVVNMGIWGGGAIWCKVAGFLDFALAMEYPLLLISLAVILYTRRFVAVGEEPLDLPMEDMIMPQQQQQQQQLNTSRPPSAAPSFIKPSSKPPSVAGSVDGYRNRPNGSVMQPRPTPPSSTSSSRPFHVPPNRPGSVTGSIEGRLAAGRMSANRRPQQLHHQHHAAGGPSPSSMEGSRLSAVPERLKPSQGFRTSSPLREVDETNCSVGDADDLWDAASLDYPGRDFESPRGWDFMEHEVKYYTWHNILLGFTWLLAIGIGVPAAMMIEYFPHKRPGCYVPVDPFNNPYSYTINDPGFNFQLSFLVISYMISAVTLFLLLILICWHRMADKRFRTFVKMLSTLTAVFVISRSPVDVIQLKGLIEAAMGFNLKDPFEIEYEIVLIWVSYLPLVFNPIVYFSFLSEYRQGTFKILRSLCGCQSEEERREQKMALYKEEEIKASKENMAKTQESNIL